MNRIVTLVFLVIIFYSTSFGQKSNIVLDSTQMWDVDIERAKLLIENGVEIRTSRLRCWFPKDSLTMNEMKGITDTMNAGVLELEKYIKAPLEWQKFGTDTPIEIFFASDKFIDHAYQNMGYVFIPFEKIKSWKSPWLHEITHVILSSKNGNWYLNFSMDEIRENKPTWLHEGLADYLSWYISLSEDFEFYDDFSDSFITDIDSLFVSELEKENSKEIIPYIGSKGATPLLEGENRNRYAPIFYYGSFSLTKYIAAHYGLEVLLTANAKVGKEHEMIEELTGKSLNKIKNEWKAELRIE